MPTTRRGGVCDTCGEPTGSPGMIRCAPCNNALLATIREAMKPEDTTTTKGTAP